MDRDRGTGSSPEELGSFDLAKMSEADVAAELAQRMVLWKTTRRRADANPPDATTHGPPSRRPAGHVPIAQQPIGPPLTADQPTADGLDPAAAARIDRALRMATGQNGTRAQAARRPASPYGADFSALLAEGPNLNAAGMKPPRESRAEQALRRAREIRADTRRIGAIAHLMLWQAPASRIDQAHHRARALSVTARTVTAAGWQALKPALKSRRDHALQRARALAIAAWQRWVNWGPVRWPLAASALVIAIAIAAWLLTPREQAAPPEVALPDVALPPPEVPPPVALARVKPALAPEAVRLDDTDGPPIAAPAKPAPRSEALDSVKPPPAPEALESNDAEVRPPVAVAPARPVLAPEALESNDAEVRPPVAVAPARPAPAPEPLESDDAEAPLPPTFRPAPTGPDLIARLKPATDTAEPDEQTQPETQLQETGPLSPLPPAAQAQETTDEPRKHADPRAIDSMLDSMFSDGL